MCHPARDNGTRSAEGQGIDGRCSQEAATFNDGGLQVTLDVMDISLFSAWSGAHHLEQATNPHCCHGVFTDRSIFSLNLPRILNSVTNHKRGLNF